MNNRWLFSGLGAFSGFTIAWIVCGALTPGDYQWNGHVVLALSSLVGATAIGGLLGKMRHGPWARAAISAMAAISVVFWLAVPSGWWAKGPPGL